MYFETVTVPGRDDAAEVIAAEVDEHHVLRALLRVALELLGEDRVLGGRGATGASAGNRVGRELVLVDLDEQLGLAPTTSNDGTRTKNRYGLGLTRRKAAIQPDAVERLAGRGVGGQVERLAPGEHDLDRLAGRDGVLGGRDRANVLVVAEARLAREGV